MLFCVCSSSKRSLSSVTVYGTHPATTTSGGGGRSSERQQRLSSSRERIETPCYRADLLIDGSNGSQWMSARGPCLAFEDTTKQREAGRHHHIALSSKKEKREAVISVSARVARFRSTHRRILHANHTNKGVLQVVVWAAAAASAPPPRSPLSYSRSRAPPPRPRVSE
jgi:hypothetical protein